MSDLNSAQNYINITFPKSGESWVILSDIEQSIKKKIEAIGTPLKDWDIKIYRGILTGCNDAFIIDKEKRDELIRKPPKSAEIIRPILRGKDIKRYTYNFADKYLIATFPCKKYNIDNYPSVKEYLLNFGKTDTVHLSKYGNNCWGKKRLEQSGNKGSRKKTNNKCFELQDSIAYWEDFSKQKIIYPNMTKFLPFYLDNTGFFVNQKCFILTGKNLSYLTAFLNSNIFKLCYRNNFPELKGGTRELSKIFFENILIPKVCKKINSELEFLVQKIQVGTENLIVENKINYILYRLYDLTDKEIHIIDKNYI